MSAAGSWTRRSELVGLLTEASLVARHPKQNSIPDAPPGFQERSVWIYCLMDPRSSYPGQPPEEFEGRIRYIGRSWDTEKRYKQHLYGHQSNPWKQRWIRELRREGLKPAMILLEECAGDTWRERERWWENHFRELGEPLTNLAECGEGRIVYYVSSAHRDAMRRAAERRCDRSWGPFISPEGVVYSDVHNLETFAREHGLLATGMARLHKGRHSIHRGWTCSREEAREALDSRPRASGMILRRERVDLFYLKDVADKLNVGRHTIQRMVTDGYLHPDERGGWQIFTEADVQKAGSILEARAAAVMRIEVNGEIRTVAEWAATTGLPLGTLRARLRNGWDPVEAVTTSSRGRPVSDESRRKTSERFKGQVSPMKGRKHSPETLAKMRNSQSARFDRGDAVLKEYAGFVDPTGQPVAPIRGLGAYCACRGLSQGGMKHVYRGERRSHKGYTCPSALEARAAAKRLAPEPPCPSP